jgi:hypothetical protein
MSYFLNKIIRDVIEKEDKEAGERARKKMEIRETEIKNEKESNRPRTPAEKEQERLSIKQIRFNVLARGDYWDPEPYGYTDEELDK